MYSLGQGRFTPSPRAPAASSAPASGQQAEPPDREDIQGEIGRYQFVQDMIAKMVWIRDLHSCS